MNISDRKPNLKNSRMINYDAIAKCHVEGESTVFIEFMLTQIDNILEELLNQMTNSTTDDAILDADGANHGADNMERQLRYLSLSRI